MRALRTALTQVLVLAVMLLGGCGRISGLLDSVSLFHPVWSTDGWVYYLREVTSTSGWPSNAAGTGRSCSATRRLTPQGTPCAWTARYVARCDRA